MPLSGNWSPRCGGPSSRNAYPNTIRRHRQRSLPPAQSASTSTANSSTSWLDDVPSIDGSISAEQSLETGGSNCDKGTTLGGTVALPSVSSPSASVIVHSPASLERQLHDFSALRLDELPDHILLCIFWQLARHAPRRLLRVVGPVCHRWRRLAYSPQLWPSLDLELVSQTDQRKVSAMKELLVKVSTGVRCLSFYLEEGPIDGVTFVTGSLLPSLPALTVLDLGFNKGLELTVIDYIIDQCPNVESINLEGSKEINDKSMEVISRGWYRLKELCLSHCVNVTDEGIRFLAEHSHGLRMINVDGISSITDRAIEAVVEGHKETLERLYLDGAELSDLALFSLTQCRRLNTLAISFAENFSDTALNYLKEMESLEHLHMRKGFELTVDGFLSAFTLQHFRHLKYLNLTECSAINDQCVDALTKCCPNLRSLNLSWCWSITEKGLHRIVTRLHDLCCLDVVGLDQIKGGVFRDCPELYLSKLQFVDLRECHLIEDEGIVQLVQRKRDLITTNYYGEFVQVPSEVPGADASTADHIDAARELLARIPGGCCMTHI